MYKKYISSGFTIIELLVVIVVIAILAAITIVAYSGITTKAIEATMKSDLQSAASILGLDNANEGSYPSVAADANQGKGLQTTAGNSLSYAKTTAGFCVVISNPRLASTFYTTEAGAIASGTCLVTIVDGAAIQTVTTANCPTTRTRVVDARDNHTYWVQKLTDGKCWMLTNLAYAGGGVNTYGDVKALVNGTSDTDTSLGYTTSRYQIVPSTTNYTTEPTNPSTSTNGIGQYGYFYSRCGAAGGQATKACGYLTITEDAMISVCPAGWRVPVMDPTGPNDIGPDLGALNTAINNGRYDTDAGLRTAWLGQYAGYWNVSFNSAGASGYYWTAPFAKASAFRLSSGSVGVIGMPQDVRLALRCLAV